MFKKSLLLTMASIFAIGSFFTSCKKDHINSMNEDKFSLMSQSLEKPFLIISEFDDYEAIMEEPEGTPISIIPNNFKSLKDILDIPEMIQKISSGKIGSIKPTIKSFLKPLPRFIFSR